MTHLRPHVGERRGLVEPEKEIIVTQGILRMNSEHTTKSIGLFIERMKLRVAEGSWQPIGGKDAPDHAEFLYYPPQF